MIAEALLLAFLTVHQPQLEASSDVVLATHSISLENRYANSYVNDIFKDNILLAMNYLSETVTNKNQINWDAIRSPFKYEFTLNPGESFAFHDGVLKNHSQNLVKTMNTRFMWNEGYKSDGFIVGDGVCHLASIIYWAAMDAKITAYAPSNHNFAKINDVPKEYGVAIEAPSPMGNLYITNTLDKSVTFVFNYDGTNLNVSILRKGN